MDLGYDREELGYEEGYGSFFRDPLPTVLHQAKASQHSPAYNCDSAPTGAAPISRQTILTPQPSLPPSRILSLVQGNQNPKKPESPNGSSVNTTQLPPSRVDSNQAQHILGATDPKKPVSPSGKGEVFSLQEGKARANLKSALNEKGIKGAAEKTYMARFNKFKPEERANILQKDLVRVKELSPQKLRGEISKLWRHPKPEKVSLESVDKKNQEVPVVMRPLAGLLRDDANIESMEGLRKRLSDPKQVGSINQEVKSANVKGNDPLDQLEKDRAGTIMDTLNSKPKKSDLAAREGRANRLEGRSERAKDRNLQIQTEKTRQEGEDRRARENREFQRQQNSIERDFKAAETKKDREYQSVERQKDREKIR